MTMIRTMNDNDYDQALNLNSLENVCKMTTEPDIDLYAFFSITSESTNKEIRKAYKLKAKELHPDKNKNNPKAKEEFQNLKKYHDFLLNPTEKSRYDTKIKAKLASQKRHAELDDERRRLKETLEAREKEAAVLRKTAQQQSAKERVAERIRNEWEAEKEAMAHSARQERLLQQQLTETEKRNASSVTTGSTLRVKWNSKQEHDLNFYTKDFLRICLSEFGSIAELVVGKKGTALVEYSSKFDARDAMQASITGSIGFPENPLRLLLLDSGGCDPQQPLSTHRVISPDNPSQFSQPSYTTGKFDDFESDILAKMMKFG